ncbi:phytoene desaturase family protein [Stygiolobus caldivivus]|uniref:Pyridine nucleotide-disulfide oxidoreductase domain-containing protein 2 n=1 Tax=Stygiolobus caldivivus TaxID=2824673 RepID=A0A8D5ZJI8_9CREN|nr:NAD(P)/FAD-dependent oxidoreductase [Stygiolobus caldivivus]BCU70217.1 FAD-dependent oxidoreductase [Stygiolobus caldivivus]
MKVIVVGGGHNGLTVASLLAEKGFKVTVFEAREKLGGMTDTVEVNGVKLSRASYVLGLMPDFLVKKFGIPVIKGDVFQTFYVNGKVIPFWRDKEKRIKELVRAGEKKYPEFEEKLLKFKDLLYKKFMFVSRPPTKDEIREEAEKLGLGEFVDSHAKKLLSEYISEEYHYFFIYPGMERTSAYVIAYFFSPDWALVEGGMGRVAEKVVEFGKRYGVEYRVNSKVERIIVKGEEVKGVIVNGKEYNADAVVLATSPLVFPDLTKVKVNLPIARWKKYNIILRDFPRIPEPLRGYEYSLLDTEAGEVIIPSVLDKSRGGVVLETMGDLDEVKEIFKIRDEDIVYVDKINGEVSQALYNLPFGNLNHLPMTDEFLFEKRSGYKTQYTNLYLCSAGTYPGGQVTGIPAYNVANLILSSSSG